MQDDAERILPFADLKSGQANIFRTARLLVKTTNDDLFPCHTVFDGSLSDTFTASLNVSIFRRKRASENWRFKTGRESHAMNCVNFSFVEAAGVQAVYSFRNIVAREDKVGMESGLALLTSFRRNDSDRVGLFTASKVVIV